MRGLRLNVVLMTGVPFGVLMSLYLLWHLGTDDAARAIGYGAAAGFLFGAILDRFIARQGTPLIDEGPLARHEGERVLLVGAANHFLRGEGRGGKLMLTERRLIFTSHGKNFQNQGLEVPLAEIVSCRPRRTLGIIPNGLEVVRASGQVERFVVWNRQVWADRISGVCGPRSEGPQSD
jgi:hypothetical protein